MFVAFNNKELTARHVFLYPKNNLLQDINMIANNLKKMQLPWQFTIVLGQSSSNVKCVGWLSTHYINKPIFFTYNQHQSPSNQQIYCIFAFDNDNGAIKIKDEEMMVLLGLLLLAIFPSSILSQDSYQWKLKSWYGF